MHIVGDKVTDYYDSLISQFGYSKEGNIFMREPEFVSKNSEYSFMLKEFPRNAHRISSNDRKKDYIYKCFRVLFCGVIYGGMVIYEEVPSVIATKYHFFYTFDTLIEFLNENNISLKPDMKRHERWWSGLRSDEIFTEKFLEPYFIPDHSQKELCAARKLVIATAEPQGDSSYRNETSIELNGALKRFQFYKVFDPYTAYQELSMWVDGHIAAPGNVMVEIADRFRIENHGFDIKTSFRRAPTKRR